VSFELEADRMANIRFDEKEFKKELDVVKEERRWRTDDNPIAKTGEQFRAVAYRTSPYRRPVIGWMHDLDNLTVDDGYKWYQRWYTPSNATLVVAGDVDAKEIFALAQKTFGQVKSFPVTAVKPAVETPQLGLTEVTVEAAAKQPYFMMGYKTPHITLEGDNSEAFALEVLVGVLDGGDSARLANELVRKQKVAASASASYSAFTRLPAMMTFSGIPAHGKTIGDVQSALAEQIERIKKHPVTEAELKRVQAQVIAERVYEQDSVFYQAMEIGMLETIGLDWKMSDQYIDNIKAVTAEQVQAVANKYLTQDNLTIARLKPITEKEKS
jgi:zinc protease